MTPNSFIGSVRAKSALIGFQRRIELPSIPPGREIQFSGDNSADVRALLRRFGSGNYLNVVNLDAGPVEVRPDLMRNRAMYAPGGSVISEDDTMFQSFSVRNTGTEATTEGRIAIVFGVVRPSAKSQMVDGRRF